MKLYMVMAPVRHGCRVASYTVLSKAGFVSVGNSDDDRVSLSIVQAGCPVQWDNYSKKYG